MSSIQTAKAKYIKKVKLAVSENSYAEGMAIFFGTDKATIAATDPAKKWVKKMTNVDVRAKNWVEGMRTAFFGEGA